jgi:hypothetical protein
MSDERGNMMGEYIEVDGEEEVNPNNRWRSAAKKINKKCASYEQHKQTEIDNIIEFKDDTNDDAKTSFDESIKYMKEHQPCWTGNDEMFAKIKDEESFMAPAFSQGGRLSRRKQKSRSKSKSKKTMKRKRHTKSKTKSKTTRKTKRKTTRKRIYK